MKEIVILLIAMISLSASGLPDVECMGIYRNRTIGETVIDELKQASYDPDYYSTTFYQYEVGADYSYLPSQGIGLIVYNNATHRSTNVTSGFRRVGNSKVMEADLKLYDVSESGEDILVGLQCNYIEP